MMQRKTVFIVGAGASSEFNLPLGSKLIERISYNLNFSFGDRGQISSGSPEIHQALRVYAASVSKKPDDYMAVARHICDAAHQTTSIDNFIDTHRSNEYMSVCGKMAIFKSILAAEKASKLFFENDHEFFSVFPSILKNTADTWLAKFFFILTEGATWSDIPARLENIAFITFNYDRCIEHYLFCALKNYYRPSDHELLEALRALKIFHVYGSLGPIFPHGPESPVRFGKGSLDSKLLINSLISIRTFTENYDSSGSLKEMKDIIREASFLVFLGFAYHRQSLELLKTESCKAQDVFGTCFGFSEHNKEWVISDIKNYFQKNYSYNLIMDDLKASELFVKYSRSFAL